MRRTREITFRLAPPSQANSVEVVLSEDEYRAVERAAQGEALGPFVRGLVTAAVEPTGGFALRTAHELAQAHAGGCGLSLGVWLRLVVLMSIGVYVQVEADVSQARSWLAKR